MARGGLAACSSRRHSWRRRWPPMSPLCVQGKSPGGLRFSAIPSRGRETAGLPRSARAAHPRPFGKKGELPGMPHCAMIAIEVRMPAWDCQEGARSTALIISALAIPRNLPFTCHFKATSAPFPGPSCLSRFQSGAECELSVNRITCMCAQLVDTTRVLFVSVQTCQRYAGLFCPFLKHSLAGRRQRKAYSTSRTWR